MNLTTHFIGFLRAKHVFIPDLESQLECGGVRVCTMLDLASVPGFCTGMFKPLIAILFWGCVCQVLVSVYVGCVGMIGKFSHFLCFDTFVWLVWLPACSASSRVSVWAQCLFFVAVLISFYIFPDYFSV